MGNPMNNKNQILFDFKLNKSYLDQDYYLSSSNQDEYNFINSWPKWIKKSINLYDHQPDVKVLKSLPSLGHL